MIGSSDQQVGKGLAVVAVVVVEQQLWWLGQSVGFGYDLIAGVEGVLESWDLVAKKNWNEKIYNDTFIVPYLGH